MSLIGDQQRKNSKQKQPVIKPLKVQAQPVQIQAPEAPEAPAPAPASEANFIEFAAPDAPPLPEAPAPEPEPAAPAPAPAGDAALDEALDLTPTPGAQALNPPAASSIVESVGKLQAPTVLEDVGQQYGDSRIYAPEVISTKVPTVFDTLNTQSTHDLVKQGYAGINETATRRHAEQEAAVAESQRQLEDRNRLVNVPRVDKPWHAAPADANATPFGDILFGSEQHRRDQPFRPEQGSFGKQGAGLLGGLNYLLNLPVNLTVGLAAEANAAAESIFKAAGMKEADAQNFARNGVLGLLPERMRPSSLLGFDWKKAQQRNLVQDAIRGDQVGDTNDPRGVNKGAFFSPRRSQNIRSRQVAQPGNPLSQIDQGYNDVVAVAQDDPIGTAIEVMTQLFNPGDAIMDNVWGAAWKRFARKAPAAPAPAPPKRPLLESTSAKRQAAAAKPVPPAPPKQTGYSVYNGYANYQPPVSGKPQKASPAAPDFAAKLPQVPGYNPRQKPQLPATVPQKAPRVIQGTSEVVQKALPPVVEPSVVKATDVDDLMQTPSGTALQVGIGSPSTKPIPAPTSLIIKAADDSTEALLDVAEELATHKAIIAQPLQQLDELFETTVDFGRKAVDELPFETLSTEAVARAFQTGAKLNLPQAAIERIAKTSPDIAFLISEAAYEPLQRFIGKTSIKMENIYEMISEVNNLSIRDLAMVAEDAPLPKDFLIEAPRQLFHGTALANWTPQYNWKLNGSRGELGMGMYLTNDNKVAAQYAGALMGENAPPGSLNKDIEPAVHTISFKGKATLDARASIPSNSEFIDNLLEGLDEDFIDNVKRSLQRDNNTTYVGLLNKLEANLVRSDLEPTEEVLRMYQEVLADNLRILGYDSVYDSKSGFLLALDETKTLAVEVNKLQVPVGIMDSVVNRYNVDSYAAKFYPERLTTDANLRDSAAKVLNQLEDMVDTELKTVQQEIIKRGLDERSTLLPKLERLDDESVATVDDALAPIPPASKNPCQP
jgi:hypothetical protein